MQQPALPAVVLMWRASTEPAPAYGNNELLSYSPEVQIYLQPFIFARFSVFYPRLCGFFL